MLLDSLVRKVTLQMLGVGTYFGLVAILYWRRLTDAGAGAVAVAVILGLLLLFKSVVDSGAISIAHLFPWDPKAVGASPLIELLKMVSFLAVGAGLTMDLRVAADLYVIPDRMVDVIILLTVMFVFISGAACCLIRFITAVKYWGRQ
jgi:hypothetical protein